MVTSEMEVMKMIRESDDREEKTDFSASSKIMIKSLRSMNSIARLLEF